MGVKQSKQAAAFRRPPRTPSGSPPPASQQPLSRFWENAPFILDLKSPVLPGYLILMNILKAFFLLTAALATMTMTNCATPEQPGDASEAVYEAPDRIENQERLQEMHGDILRSDF